MYYLLFAAMKINVSKPNMTKAIRGLINIQYFQLFW